MRVRIFHRQPFGCGGGIQSGICRYQYQRRNLCPDFQRRRQLHGIIAPQRMEPRERTGMTDQGR